MKRMRKWLAALMALALLAACAAAEADAVKEAAAEANGNWREGMSPSKPYAGVPEVDLSAKLGYMIFFPTQARTVENSCKNLYVYLPRTDVKAGEGKLYLCTEDEGALWQTAMNDESAVKQRELTAAEKNSLMWGEGTCFEVTLPRSLELGKTYFVNLERGGIETRDGELANPAIGGTDMWTFTLEGDYGVNGMEYRRVLRVTEPEPTEAPAETEAPAAVELGAEPVATAEPPQPVIEYSEPLVQPKPGDEIRFDLVLGGEAAMAVVYGYYGTVDFEQIMFEESGEVTGKVLSETPWWGVMFLDKDGNELHRVEFR